MPLALVANLTDIGSVVEDGVQLVAGESPLRWEVFDTFSLQGVGQTIECVTVVSIEVIRSRTSRRLRSNPRVHRLGKEHRDQCLRLRDSRR